MTDGHPEAEALALCLQHEAVIEKLRSALKKVLDTSEKEAKARLSLWNAQTNFSDGGTKESNQLMWAIQHAQVALDAKGVNRTGMDVSHNKPLARGGTNKDGYKLESPAKNRSRNLQSKKK